MGSLTLVAYDRLVQRPSERTSSIERMGSAQVVGVIRPLLRQGMEAATVRRSGR